MLSTLKLAGRGVTIPSNDPAVAYSAQLEDYLNNFDKVVFWQSRLMPAIGCKRRD